MSWLLWAYLGLVMLMSLVTFVAYGIDKRQARVAGRRISEKTLQRFALIGGWPGAWAGQQFFRHKTSKRSFQWRFWLIVVSHLGLIGMGVYVATR